MLTHWDMACALFQYPIRRLIVRFRELSKSRDKLSESSLWNVTGTLAALLQRCLSNFRAIIQFRKQNSRLRFFARSWNKMSYRILKRGPGYTNMHQWAVSSLFRVMTGRLFGTHLSPDSMPAYYQLHPKEKQWNWNQSKRMLFSENVSKCHSGCVAIKGMKSYIASTHVRDMALV